MEFVNEIFPFNLFEIPVLFVVNFYLAVFSCTDKPFIIVLVSRPTAAWKQ